MAHHIPRRILHQRFLSILPVILRHARVYFRAIRCYHTKEDRIAEVRALCWKWFKRLAELGKDACEFPTRLADFAARAVKCGRRVCGQLKTKDVLSELAQQRHGFYVGKLIDVETLSDNPITDALIDNTQTPVDEQVCFRCDFPAWRASYDDRRQQIMDALALGHRTKDVARQFDMSEGRISQLRREFMEDWNRFTAEGPTHPS
jgi:hypothetical protein